MNKMQKGYGVPFRYNKLPTPEEVLEADFDENSGFFNHLMNLKMNDAMMSDEERTSPDTFACDKIFLDHFITERISDIYTVSISRIICGRCTESLSDVLFYHQNKLIER